MIDSRVSLMVVGSLMLVLGIAMGLVGLIDHIVNDPNAPSEAMVFYICALITLFIGAMLTLTNRTPAQNLNPRTLFFLISAVWVILPIFAALPFMFGTLDLAFIDAYFEAVSGITTTGATVLSGLDGLPTGILLWRSFLQWMGGIGVVVMAISALPMLRLGGMQIFRMEFAESLDKALPRAAQIGLWIFMVYTLLTFICMILYYMAGMDFFDALNHAMTTLSTGGYSTHDRSFQYFNNGLIDLIAILFMVLGSLPFLHYVQALRGNSRSLWRDSQVHWFLAILASAILMVSYWLMQEQGISILSALRLASFNVTSMMTGTGYASADFNQWGPFVPPLLFALMFIGGCAGSTTCGLKVFRLQVLTYAAKAQMHRLLKPHGVFLLYYNGKPLSEGVAESVMGFFFFYVIIFGILATLLGATGLDFTTAVSGAAATLANVGPGLGEVIGPAGNFTNLPIMAKWFMVVGMILGRLEIFTLLVLILPKFWRD